MVPGLRRAATFRLGSGNRLFGPSDEGLLPKAFSAAQDEDLILSRPIDRYDEEDLKEEKEEKETKRALPTLGELLAGQLERAQRTLAVQHESAVRLVTEHVLRKRSAEGLEGELMRLRLENKALQARVSGATAEELNGHTGPAGFLQPAQLGVSWVTSDEAAAEGHRPLSRGCWEPSDDPARPSSRRSWDALPDAEPPRRPSSRSSLEPPRCLQRISEPPRQPTGTDDPPMRPSSRGAPGKPVPFPTADIPKMALPGQVDEAFAPKGEGASQDEDHKLTLLPIWKRRRGRTPLAAKRYRRSGLTQVNLPDWFEDDKEEAHTKKAKNFMKHFVFHPMTPRRSIWDVASMLLVLWDMVMIPMGFFELPPNLVTDIMDWVTRVFWTLDIPTSFLSGFIALDGTIEMRPWWISKRYLKTWFFLDATVVGTDWVELSLKSIDSLGFARVGKATRIFRILRMVRLLRLARMGEVFNLMLERLPSEVLVVFGDIMKLVICMMSAGHMVACLWYAVGQASPPDKNWVVDFGFAKESLQFRYIVSLRWALSQFAGGMDEVTPISFEEQVFAACIYIMAYWSGTVFLSVLTSHMTQLYIMGSQTTQQLSMLRRYLAQHGVSRGLALRAQRNAQHVILAQQRTMSAQVVGLMDLVSQALRIELHFEMHSPSLSLHPFFAHYTRECPHVVRKVCHAAVSMSANSKGDVIFHFGEASTSMVIVKSGQLQYTYSAEQVEHEEHVDEGNWIAEPSLWVRWVHRGMASVIQDSIIFHIQADAFQNIVDRFELTSFDPAEYAELFVEHMNNTTGYVTDLPLSDFECHGSKLIGLWKQRRNSALSWQWTAASICSEDSSPVIKPLPMTERSRSLHLASASTTAPTVCDDGRQSTEVMGRSGSVLSADELEEIEV